MKFGILFLGDSHPELGRSNQRYYSGGSNYRRLGREARLRLVLARRAPSYKAWRNEQFSHRRKYYPIEDGSLCMMPVQKPLPPTWIASSVTHVICMVNFGGVPMADVRRTLELMSEEILPKLR